MPYRKNNLGMGSFYHVFNRGANRQGIFYESENYDYFLRLFKSHSTVHKTGIVCYCLMPNHFHFLLFQESEKPISKLMQGLLSAYTQALNNQQNRKGTLFEGRFKHVLIDKHSYLIQLIMYIHFNPVKAGLVTLPEDWKYSDYRYWIDVTSNFPKVPGENLHGNFRKVQMMDIWNIKRVKQFRDLLEIPAGDEYKNLIKEYQKLFEENKETEKYLFD